MYANRFLIIISSIYFILSACVLPVKSADWVETYGAKMRLIHDGEIGSGNQLTGVIHVQLEQGWKTYWREPGDSGIPPTFSFFSGDKALDAKLYFPTPVMIDDGYVQYAGYKNDVYFPFIVDVSADLSRSALSLDAFIGVCEQICVPFSAQFEIIAGARGQKQQGTYNGIIEQAFADLPQSQTHDFEIISYALNPSKAHITFTAQLPGFYPTHFEPQLFIDAPDNIQIAQPVLIKIEGNQANFQSQIYSATDHAPSGPVALYTLLTLGPRAGEKTISLESLGQHISEKK